MTATTHDELSMEAILRRIRERYAEEQLREQLPPAATQQAMAGSVGRNCFQFFPYRPFFAQLIDQCFGSQTTGG
jgi:hypothetical protein